MRRDCPTSFHFSNKPFTAERQVPLCLFSYSFHVNLPRAHCSSTPLMHRSASLPLACALWTREQIGIKGESANGGGYTETSPNPETMARAYERRERFVNDKRINCNAVDLVASGAESGLKNPIRWLDDWLITFDLLAGSQGDPILVDSCFRKFPAGNWKIISRGSSDSFEYRISGACTVAGERKFITEMPSVNIWLNSVYRISRWEIVLNLCFTFIVRVECNFILSFPLLAPLNFLLSVSVSAKSTLTFIQTEK